MLEHLKKHILDVGNEVAQYELAFGNSMSDRDRIMCLEDICPDQLQQHFESRETLKCYSDCKMAINDYLANRARWVGKIRVNWLDDISGNNTSNGEENYGGQIEIEIEILEGQLESMMEHFQELNVLSGEINALVTTKFGKKGKGSRKS